jgi:hypothetical protein
MYSIATGVTMKAAARGLGSNQSHGLLWGNTLQLYCEPYKVGPKAVNPLCCLAAAGSKHDSLFMPLL